MEAARACDQNARSAFAQLHPLHHHLQLALVALLAVALLPRTPAPSALIRLDGSDFAPAGVGAPPSATGAAALASAQPGGDAPIEGHHKAAAGDDVYAVVIDAGSTGERGEKEGVWGWMAHSLCFSLHPPHTPFLPPGSRVHVFRFGHASGGTPELEDDTFEAVKPGLSSYASDPAAAAASLQPLLDLALKTVPAAKHATTTLTVGATAGLRLLPDGQADAILEAVRKHLSTSVPFSVDPASGVTILDGQAEGAFAWLTLNYLLGKLGAAPGDTVAAIDLGGGSVQHAYALSSHAAEEAPPGYVRRLSVAGGGKYSVYVHSYLGYGLMAGRSAVLKAGDRVAAALHGGASGADATLTGHPCVPEAPCGGGGGSSSSSADGRKEKAGTDTPPPTPTACAYKYGPATHDLAAASTGGASFGQCAAVARDALAKGRPCGAPVHECSFDGAWGGGGRPSALYVSSYFWDRAVDAGLVTDVAASVASVKPADWRRAGEAACAPHTDAVKAAFPAAPADVAPYLCLDLAFQHALLTHGFGLGEKQGLTLVKKVQYRGREVEAAWPLGAALDALAGGR